MEEGTFPVPRAEPRTLPGRNVGAPLPTQDEALPFEASAGDDSDEDDILEMAKKSRASLMQFYNSPNAVGPDIPKQPPIPTQCTPHHPPAALEENEDEEKEDVFLTPSGSPTGTGRHSPPLITSQSSPGVRQIPEGQSNVFPPQSVSRYPGE